MVWKHLGRGGTLIYSTRYRDNWAKTISPNPNVKVYIGAPASSSAAGSGYVPISSLTSIIQQTKAQYSSFGGVMLWDASQAYGERFSSLVPSKKCSLAFKANGRFDAAVKSALRGDSSPPPPPPPPTENCAGVNAWDHNVAVSNSHVYILA